MNTRTHEVVKLEYPEALDLEGRRERMAATPAEIDRLARALMDNFPPGLVKAGAPERRDGEGRQPHGVYGPPQAGTVTGQAPGSTAS